MTNEAFSSIANVSHKNISKIICKKIIKNLTYKIAEYENINNSKGIAKPFKKALYFIRTQGSGKEGFEKAKILKNEIVNAIKTNNFSRAFDTIFNGTYQDKTGKKQKLDYGDNTFRIIWASTLEILGGEKFISNFDYYLSNSTARHWENIRVYQNSPEDLKQSFLIEIMEGCIRDSLLAGETAGLNLLSSIANLQVFENINLALQIKNIDYNYNNTVKTVRAEKPAKQDSQKNVSIVRAEQISQNKIDTMIASINLSPQDASSSKKSSISDELLFPVPVIRSELPQNPERLPNSNMRLKRPARQTNNFPIASNAVRSNQEQPVGGTGHVNINELPLSDPAVKKRDSNPVQIPNKSLSHNKSQGANSLQSKKPKKLDNPNSINEIGQNESTNARSSLERVPQSVVDSSSADNSNADNNSKRSFSKKQSSSTKEKKKGKTQNNWSKLFLLMNHFFGLKKKENNEGSNNSYNKHTDENKDNSHNNASILSFFSSRKKVRTRKKDENFEENVKSSHKEAQTPRKNCLTVFSDKPPSKNSTSSFVVINTAATERKNSNSRMVNTRHHFYQQFPPLSGDEGIINILNDFNKIVETMKNISKSVNKEASSDFKETIKKMEKLKECIEFKTGSSVKGIDNKSTIRNFAKRCKTLLLENIVIVLNKNQIELKGSTRPGATISEISGEGKTLRIYLEELYHEIKNIHQNEYRLWEREYTDLKLLSALHLIKEKIELLNGTSTLSEDSSPSMLKFK